MATIDMHFNESENYWYYIPEFSYRIIADGRLQDAINLATDSFFPIPVRMESGQSPLVRKSKEWDSKNMLSKYKTNRQIGVQDIMMIFSGIVVNRSWLAFLSDQIVHIGETAPYTHTHDTSETMGINNPPKTFALLNVKLNPKTANIKILLYTGCYVKSYSETGSVNQFVTGTWEVHASNEVTGAALNTYPTLSTSQYFSFGEGFTYTFVKGETPYTGVIKSYTFKYDTDKRLNKGMTSLLGLSVLPSNETDVSLLIQIAPYDYTIIDELETDPLTASAKVFTMKIARNSVSDYFQIVFTKAFEKFIGLSYLEGVMVLDFEIMMNTDESGHKLVITEVNADGSTRY